MRLGDYPVLSGRDLNAIACILVREAGEDLKPIIGGGKTMNHGAEIGIMQPQTRNASSCKKLKDAKNRFSPRAEPLEKGRPANTLISMQQN